MTRILAPRDTTYQQFKPATEKQRAFIERLLTEKDATGTAYEGWTPDWNRATSKAASAVIDYLMTLPRKSATDKPVIDAGIYESDGHLFRVYLGQKTGNMLVKAVEMDEGVEYRYLGAASRFLPAGARRLSLEEVGHLGKAWDHCLICGRRLDDPESVDRGIGPVCANRY